MREVERFVQKSTRWIERARARLPKQPKTTRIESSAAEYAKLKGAAQDFVERRLAHFNTFYRFSYRKIFIRNQKSRWGSCSSAGNLVFNYRIIFLPPYLADYLLVHELCHLREMNHSRGFWELLARRIPDYKVRRKALRKFEQGLLVD